MALHYVGVQTFTEQCEPIVGKNEFGMDTLQRVFRGATPLLASFLASLSQGSRAPSPYGQMALQTWETNDDNKGYSKVFLHYKGLLNGRIPNPKSSSETSTKSISVTRTVSGQERTYDLIYKAATKTYLWISSWETAPYPSGISVGAPSIRYSVYTNTEGRRIAGFPPSLSLTADVDNDRRSEVYGTPFWENEVTIAGVILP